jgi:hypothetical protein
VHTQFSALKEDLQIGDQDIGGARVRRVFTMKGELWPVRANTRLSSDQVLSIPLANRRALIDAGYIEVYPKSSPAKRANEERFIIRTKGDHDIS